MRTDQPFDPWTTEGGNEVYDAAKVYTRSVDKRGFGSSQRTKFPPEILSEIGKIVAKEWVPEYGSVQDFVRDAVVHRLHYWSERITDNQLRRVVTEERRMAMLEHSTREVENAQSMCLKFEEGFRVALTAEDREVLEDLMDHIVEAIHMAREPYASKLNTIRQHYTEAMERLSKPHD